MSTYEIIISLCEKDGIALTALETKLGFGRGSLGKLKNGGSTSIKRLQKIADYFNVGIDYLTGNKSEERNADNLTVRDTKEITEMMNGVEELLKQDGLMFDGTPASQEAIDSILSAMKIGMEMAKQRNKEKYTPKKYKKD